MHLNRLHKFNSKGLMQIKFQWLYQSNNLPKIEGKLPGLKKIIVSQVNWVYNNLHQILDGIVLLIVQCSTMKTGAQRGILKCRQGSYS